MADLFVPKIVDKLSDVMMKQLEKRVNLVMGVEEEVGNLYDKLKTIEKVLHDAERRRLKESDVRIWLEKLEDITYEMEDVLDEWNLKVVKPKEDLHRHPVKPGRMPTLMKNVCSFIPSLSTCLKQIPARSGIVLKIKEINDKLESTLREDNQFTFVTSPLKISGHVDSNSFDQNRMTISSVDESKVCGRDFVKESLLNHWLLVENKSIDHQVDHYAEDKVKVISMVGAGCSGKTRLAQFLFNDDRVNENFQLRKWVCVSDPFDGKRIAKALLESPETSNINNVPEWESLFRLLKDYFSGKRFLIVFDDVWSDKYSEWEPFKDSLKDGASGSIILLTTRSENGAPITSIG